MNYQKFRNRLIEEAEEGYREFALKGTITERPLLGVRIPKCRIIAKEVLEGEFDGKIITGEVNKKDAEKIRTENARDFLVNEPTAFEEVMVRGFVISDLQYPEMIKELYKFIPLIDNWAVCDCFTASIRKNVKKNQAEYLNEIDKMLKSLDEFETRVALVSLLDHYIEPDYLQVVFDRINEISPCLSDGPGELSVERAKGKTEGERKRKVMAWDAYYVKMAVAWLISVCFAKFPEQTSIFFSHLSLPVWTYNKSITKTCESYRVDKDLKAELKKMKR